MSKKAKKVLKAEVKKVSRNTFDLRDMANWLVKIAEEGAQALQPLHIAHLHKFAKRMKEIANLV